MLAAVKISRRQMEEDWAHWRVVGSRREPVGIAGDRKTLVLDVRQSAGAGKITSARKQLSQQDIEWVAFRHGVTIERAKELINLGLVKWQTR